MTRTERTRTERSCNQYAQDKINETHYFTRYPMNVPEKSKIVRKPIILPFAVNENDEVINCSFENEKNAAYIMGLPGCGKTTLLNTLISGILMNYHPDEVELWLFDLKKDGFKTYVNCTPPHIKYIYLGKSEALVFDFIDKLTEIIDNRRRIFAKTGWNNLNDVPVEIYMPAIFVIIDTLMSNILINTSVESIDYRLKLENLLIMGRMFGLRIIFSGIDFTNGASGLTEAAYNLIRIRFAMKNNSDEIKQTLNLYPSEITPEVSLWINTIQPGEILFKRRDKNNDYTIEKLKVMYTNKDEITKMISKINSTYKQVKENSITDSNTFIQKNRMLIEGL